MAEFFERTFHDPTALFTLLLFAATFGLWWATRGLVLGADDSSRRQLRAYVSVKPTLVFNWTQQSSTQHVGVRLIATNHGLSPAVEIAGELKLDVKDQPPDPLSTDIQTDFNNSIFPQQTLEIDFFLPNLLAQEAMEAVERDELRVYLWGRLSYADVFGKRHSTLVNASFGGPDFSRKIRKGDGTGWNWRYGQKHNEPVSN